MNRQPPSWLDPLLGRLMVYDALDMSYRTIKLRRDPARRPITELIDYEAFCGVVSEEGQAAAAGSTVTARELKELLDAGDVELIDVREPVEWDIVHIEGATLIPKDRILSGEALAALKRAGFADATHLQGGVIAWAHQVDPSLPVY